jgi:hypothetical protein
MLRVVLGFAVAALWLPVVLYFTAGDYHAFWFVMTASFTVPLTLFVAVPVYYFWRRRITFFRCLSAGFVIGTLGALVFLAMTNPQAALNWSPGLIGSGILTSIMFWVIAIWNNGALGGSARSETGDAAI